MDSAFIAATVTNVGGVTSTITRRIQIVQGPSLLVSAPATGSRVPTGLVNNPITIVGYSPNGIQKLGFTATGVAGAGDSITFTAPYSNSQTNARFLNTPATTPLGIDTIVPFAVTGLGARFTGKPILVAFADTVKPTVAVQSPSKTTLLTVAVADSLLVQARVTDNRGVVRVTMRGIAKRGSVLLGTDTVVTRDSLLRAVTLPQTTDTVLTRYLHPPQPIDSTSEYAYVVVTAYDSSGNYQADTAQYRIVNGPKVTILGPSNNAVTAPGKIITVSVQAKGTLSVRTLGWRATGDGVNVSDSTMPALGSLTNSLTFTSNLAVPAGTPVGQIYILGFALDTLGNPSPTLAPDTVQVQTTVASAPPTVTFSVPSRVEVGDSVTVTATGAAGIGIIGFAVHHLGRERHDPAGALRRYAERDQHERHRQVPAEPRHPDDRDVGAAGDDRGVRVGFGRTRHTLSGHPPSDTLTVVAGRTISFPQGGQFGDAVVDPNNQTLYLTNTLLDQLEVFHLASNSFGAPIRVGSQPVGIALWPRDTLGDNRDTVIVANSGGTNLSIVDVVAGAEVARHTLPDYIVSTVKTRLPPRAGFR